MDNLIICKYDDKYEAIWDDFVKVAVLSTIYHTRKFINYHPKDRFDDNSILLFLKDELICVVPACKQKEIYNVCKPIVVDENGDIDIDPSEFTSSHIQKKPNNYFSYLGATYGGPVFLRKYFETRYIDIIIKKIFTYYNNKIEFRLANNIYFDDNIFMVYSLLSSKLRMVPELSWYINTDDDFINKINNRRNKSSLLKMINNDNITCFQTQCVNDYNSFYSILEKNLSLRHDTNPTHTHEEFLRLKEILGDDASLYIVKEGNNILGGVYVIKVTKLCWYTFYISKNIDADNNAAVPYLMYTISNDAKKENVKYLDYGICTENKGTLLNVGLADFKERTLGGISNARYLFLL